MLLQRQVDGKHNIVTGDGRHKAGTLDQAIGIRALDALALGIHNIALNAPLATQVALPGSLQAIAPNQVGWLVAFGLPLIKLPACDLIHVADEVRKGPTMRVVAIRFVAHVELWQKMTLLLYQRGSISRLIFQQQDCGASFALVSLRDPGLHFFALVGGQLQDSCNALEGFFVDIARLAIEIEGRTIVSDGLEISVENLASHGRQHAGVNNVAARLPKVLLATNDLKLPQSRHQNHKGNKDDGNEVAQPLAHEHQRLRVLLMPSD